MPAPRPSWVEAWLPLCRLTLRVSIVWPVSYTEIMALTFHWPKLLMSLDVRASQHGRIAGMTKNPELEDPLGSYWGGLVWSDWYQLDATRGLILDPPRE